VAATQKEAAAVHESGGENSGGRRTPSLGGVAYKLLLADPHQPSLATHVRLRRRLVRVLMIAEPIGLSASQSGEASHA
jgi:hypothetical protein